MSKNLLLELFVGVLFILFVTIISFNTAALIRDTANRIIITNEEYNAIHKGDWLRSTPNWLMETEITETQRNVKYKKSLINKLSVIITLSLFLFIFIRIRKKAEV